MGEYFLTNSGPDHVGAGFRHDVCKLALGKSTFTPRVIMRPVEEPKNSYTAWSIVLPFGSKRGAEDAAKGEDFRNWGIVIQEVEIHE
jgi:hypothetical protein